jgi:hypothetical protein
LQARITRYKATGFMESIIAITVAGIACIVLMRLASNVIKQVAQNERSDEMTQIAITGANMVSAIASQNNAAPVSQVFFPRITGNQGSCFQLSTAVDTPSFIQTSGVITPVCNYDAGGRSDCKSSLAPGRTDMFRVFCITSASDITGGIVVGKIVVGKTVCSDSVSCDISDYQYYSLNKTVQK